MSTITLKCRKCRAVLIPRNNKCVVSVHGDLMNAEVMKNNLDCNKLANDVFYIQESDMLAWISKIVDEEGWQKGKLLCPQCSARVGSFDFISGAKCSCEEYVVPPIHIIKSKVDYMF